MKKIEHLTIFESVHALVSQNFRKELKGGTYICIPLGGVDCSNPLYSKRGELKVITSCNGDTEESEGFFMKWDHILLTQEYAQRYGELPYVGENEFSPMTAKQAELINSALLRKLDDPRFVQTIEGRDFLVLPSDEFDCCSSDDAPLQQNLMIESLC